MISRVRLRNWRSHEETDLEFGKGTNILVGIMGAGKSAVLDAISFALFGRFPRQREVKLADIVMSRPTQKEEASVEVEFDWDGKNYAVKRTIRRSGAPEAELRIDGKMVMGEPEKVTEMVGDALKIDYDLFCRAIYSEQNRIDYFLLLNPRERKRQMDELLGIDRFGNARANLTTLLNRLAEMRGEKDARLREMDAEALGKAADAARTGAGEAEGKRKDAVGRLAKAKTEAVQAERDLGSLERVRRDFEAEKEKKGRLEGMIEAAEAEEKERAAACAGKQSLQALEAEVAKVSEMLASANEERRKADGAVAEKSKQAGEIAALLREAQKDSERKAALVKRLGELEAKAGSAAQAAEKVSSLEQAMVSARATEAGLARRAEDLGVEMGALAKGAQNCPVCEAPLGEGKAKEIGERKRREMAEAKAGIEAAKRQLEVSKAERDGLSQLLVEMQSCGHKLAEVRELGDAADAQARLSALQKEIAGLGDRKAIMERDALSFSRRSEALRQEGKAWGELERVRKRAAELKDEILKSSSRIASLRFNEQIYSEKRGAAEGVRNSAAKLEGEVRALEAEGKAAAERLAAVEARLAEALKAKDEIAHVTEAAERMSKVQDAVVETQGALRNGLMGAINETMAEIWPMLYPYRDYGGVRLRPADEDYMLEVKAADRWLPVDGIASGGERACAALALRMAFAMALVPNLRWLVLDEPTHNLDEQGIRALVEVLHERLPEIVEQVFVITHDETLKDAASARLYRFDRDKAVGEPTRALALN